MRLCSVIASIISLVMVTLEFELFIIAWARTDSCGQKDSTLDGSESDMRVIVDDISTNFIKKSCNIFGFKLMALAMPNKIADTVPHSGSGEEQSA